MASPSAKQRQYLDPERGGLSEKKPVKNNGWEKYNFLQSSKRHLQKPLRSSCPASVLASVKGGNSLQVSLYHVKETTGVP